MKTQREENPFEDQIVAEEWIRSVEGEKGMIRDLEIYPMLETWASEVSGSILEIGSGQGACSQHLGKFDGLYVGIEPSQTLTNRAKELYGNNNRLSFEIGNAYEMSLAGETFDGIFSVNVWFHLANLNKAAQELSRVLKENCPFNIITANPDNYTFWRNSFESIKEEGKLISGKVSVPVNPLTRNDIYLHTLNEIKDSFNAAGLKITKMETLGTISKYPGNPIFISIQGIKSL